MNGDMERILLINIEMGFFLSSFEYFCNRA